MLPPSPCAAWVGERLAQAAHEDTGLLVAVALPSLDEHWLEGGLELHTAAPVEGPSDVDTGESLDGLGSGSRIGEHPRVFRVPVYGH